MKKFCFSLFFFLVAVFTFLASGVVDTQDGFQYLAVARNLYYTGEPTAPPYEYTGGPGVAKNIHLNTQIGRDGKTYSSTGIGYSLAFLPAVALSDLVYKNYHLEVPVHFPLESDWLILMLASFTNGFFAAGLGVILFLFLLELKLRKTQALLIVFVGLFATNLLPYSKHVFAHMMFITFLVLTAYFIKLFSTRKKNKFLFLAGLSFGINLITYNPTSFLSVLPLALYYFLLVKPKINLPYLKSLFIQCLFFLLGFIPLAIIFYWHQQIITLDTNSYASAGYYQSYAKAAVFNLPISSLFEGLFGQLFSPGRSIFIYSPILILIIIYWFRLEKKNLAEVSLLLSLSFIYLFFYGLQRQYEPESGFIGYWAGELSWGPRYLLPLLPFGLLVIGIIYTELSKKAKLLIFTPLVLAGLLINFVGIAIPFQIKLHNLEQDVYISGQHYTSFLYMNLLPKFSPALTQFKNLQYNLKIFPKTLDHGIYNVKFYDGFDFPFSVATDRWRTIEDFGTVSFDDNLDYPIKKVSLGVINHKMTDQASSSAQITLYINDEKINPSPEKLELGEKRVIEATLAASLKPQDNKLKIQVNFDEPNSYKYRAQLLAMTNFYINDQVVNIESLDFPYLSNFGPALTGAQYVNYGKLDPNPWKSWHIHTQIFERSLDFWWVKVLYYWDIPKKPLLLGLVFNILALIILGVTTTRFFRKLNS